MSPEIIQADANATLTRLNSKHPELKKTLQQAHGFAVFPSMGRAGVVLGGAYGRGVVYEQGKPIGFASLSQMTIGVQVGGQTFSELIIFPKKPQLDQFKHGKTSFAANASAVIVKAAASGTSNPDGVTAHAYSRGGMLLELSLGGQKFSFIPPEKAAEELASRKEKKELKKQKEEKPEERRASGKEKKEEGRRREEGGEARAEIGEGRNMKDALLQVGPQIGHLFRQHPVAGTALGMGITGVGLAATALLTGGQQKQLPESSQSARQ